jgi:hypothetical protein
MRQIENQIFRPLLKGGKLQFVICKLAAHESKEKTISLLKNEFWNGLFL